MLWMQLLVRHVCRDLEDEGRSVDNMIGLVFRWKIHDIRA